IFSINNNSVFASHSSCKHKNCIHTGAISKAGQSIICIPNNIRIALDGNYLNNVDSITF
ncbi:MAG: NusG domain II-containing protein, partial [Ignavibacteriae bacterium]|nr:NusG domain II-containing protein [Ignavibacteriota bacterium]